MAVIQIARRHLPEHGFLMRLWQILRVELSNHVTVLRDFRGVLRVVDFERVSRLKRQVAFFLGTLSIHRVARALLRCADFSRNEVFVALHYF